MAFDETALLASIVHTLAAVRAALAAAVDPEQTEGARMESAGFAGSHAARLVATATAEHWTGVDPAVLEAIRAVEAPAQRATSHGWNWFSPGARDARRTGGVSTPSGAVVRWSGRDRGRRVPVRLNRTGGRG